MLFNLFINTDYVIIRGDFIFIFSLIPALQIKSIYGPDAYPKDTAPAKPHASSRKAQRTANQI